MKTCIQAILYPYYSINRNLYEANEMQKKSQIRRVNHNELPQDVQDAINSSVVPADTSKSLEERILQDYAERDREILEPALAALAKILREKPWIA